MWFVLQDPETNAHLRSWRVRWSVVGRKPRARGPTVFCRRFRFALCALGFAGSTPRSSMATCSSPARAKVLSDTHVPSVSGGSIRAGRHRAAVEEQRRGFA